MEAPPGHVVPEVSQPGPSLSEAVARVVATLAPELAGRPLSDVRVDDLVAPFDSLGVVELLVALEDCGLPVDWTDPGALLGVPDATLDVVLARVITQDRAPVDGGDESGLTGRLCRLTPVAPEHLPWLRDLVSGANAWRWRQRGELPGVNTLHAQFETTTLAHVVVESRDGSGGIGYLCTHSVDARDQVCSAAGVIAEPHRGTGRAIEAWSLFFTYLFAQFPIRKILLEVPDFNVGGVSQDWDVPGLFEREARFRDHTWAQGRWWDLHVFALWRSSWMDRVSGDAFAGSRFDGARPDYGLIG